MLVTALSPVIGYPKAAEIVKYAHEHDLNLKEACLKKQIMSADEFDKLIDTIQCHQVSVLHTTSVVPYSLSVLL